MSLVRTQQQTQQHQQQQQQQQQEQPYNKENEEIVKITVKRISTALEAVPLGVPIGTIDLSENPAEVDQITSAQLSALASVLRKNTMVNKLKFDGAKIPSVGGAVALLSSYKCMSLYDVDLSGRASYKPSSKNEALYLIKMEKRKDSIWEHYAVLSKLERVISIGHIQFLDLSYNALGHNAFAAIAKGLELNDQLLYLKLSANPSASSATPLIASALQNNHTLRKLVYRSNDVDVEGALSFAKLLQHNVALTSLSLRENPKTTFTNSKVTAAFEEAMKGNPSITELDFVSIPESIKYLLQRNISTKKHLKEWVTTNEPTLRVNQESSVSPRTYEKLMGGTDFFSLFFTTLHRHFYSQRRSSRSSSIDKARNDKPRPRSSDYVGPPKDEKVRLCFNRVLLPSLPKEFFESTSVLDWRLQMVEVNIPDKSESIIVFSESAPPSTAPAITSPRSASSSDIQPCDSLPPRPFRYLSRLVITNNQLRSIKGIHNLTALTYLDLSSNELDSLPEGLYGLAQLRTIKLASNLLKNFPEDLLHLNLTHLDLSKNLIKIIPATIGNLITLTHLRLAFNKIQNIPPEITSCKFLQALDLRWNLLSFLPAEIVQLTKIDELLLRGNPLEIFDQQDLSSPQAIFASLMKLQKEAESFALAPLVIFGDNHISKQRLSQVIKTSKSKYVPPFPTEICPLICDEWEQDDITFRCFDFVGDSTLRLCYQFFVFPSRRSTYILNYNHHEDSLPKIEQDLKMIFQTDQASSVFILTMHQGDADKRNKKEAEVLVADLKKRISGYPNVIKCYCVDASTGKGIGESRSLSRFKKKLFSKVKSKSKGIKQKIPYHYLLLLKYLQKKGKQARLEKDKDEEEYSNSERELPYFGYSKFETILQKFHIIEQKEREEVIEFLRDVRSIFLYSILPAESVVFFEPMSIGLVLGILSRLKETLLCNGKILPKDLTMLWSLYPLSEPFQKRAIDLMQLLECCMYLNDIPEMRTLQPIRAAFYDNSLPAPRKSSLPSKPSPMRRVSSMPQQALAAFKKIPAASDQLSGSVLLSRGVGVGKSSSSKRADLPVVTSPGRPSSLYDARVSAPLTPKIIVPLFIPILLPENKPEVDHIWPSTENCHETTNTITCQFLSVSYFCRIVIKVLCNTSAKLEGYWRHGVIISMKPPADDSKQLRKHRSSRTLSAAIEQQPVTNRVLIEFIPDKYTVIILSRIPKRKTVASEFVNTITELVIAKLGAWTSIKLEVSTKAKVHATSEPLSPSPKKLRARDKEKDKTKKI